MKSLSLVALRSSWMIGLNNTPFRPRGFGLSLPKILEAHDRHWHAHFAIYRNILARSLTVPQMINYDQLPSVCPIVLISES